MTKRLWLPIVPLWSAALVLAAQLHPVAHGRGPAPVSLPDSRVVRLNRMYPKSIVKAPADTILVPRPQTAVVGGHPITGVALLEWARGVIDAIIDPPTEKPAS